MRKQSILFILILFTLTACAQNGKITSKRLVELSDTPFWDEISEEKALKANYSHLEKLNFFVITYQSDGLEVRGIILEPKAEGLYPVVIFNRGGNRSFAALNIRTLIEYTSKLAAEGYVIIGSNYRDEDEFGGSDINDVLCLTETIKEIDKADAKRIGMFGWSRGGLMTYLALQKSDNIKTAIIGNGPSDMFDIIADRPAVETNVLAACVPDYWENKEEELRKRSAIHWANELDPNASLLILCGTQDRRSNPNQADKMATALTDINYDFEVQKYDTDHFFTGKKDELNAAVLAWFDARL